MTKLSVNINKVATLRNTRHLEIPGVVQVARLALDAGAHGITVHPRPDKRHIRPHDVFDVAQLLKQYPEAEYNIEGNPFEEGYVDFARAVRPAQCTLVPDSPEAFTSDHGWDPRADAERLRPVVATLKGFGCRVSLFMAPVLELIGLVPAIGANRIELYTEPYAAAHARGDFAESLARYAEAARTAGALGLGVNAGHDLNRNNLADFLRAIPFADEVSIGHALVADALEFGMARTVGLYLEAMRV